MPEKEHGRSPPETTVTMASDEPQPQLPGLGDPPAGRSDVATMGTDGSGIEEEATMLAAGGPLGDFVLIGAPWGLFLATSPLSSRTPNKKVSAHPPCPKTKRAAAAKGEKKQCVECGATETPQWRIQPKGLGALCNACRIRLRPAEALREPVHVRVHLPPPATPATVISRREKKSPSPAPATAAPEEKKKRERKRKPGHPRKSPKQCHHFKSASTPPQGRLLQEYRPAASPNFVPLEHACKQHEAVQHRQKKHKGKEHQQQPPQPAAMQPRTGGELPTGEPISMDQLLVHAIDESPETHIVYGVGGGELQMVDPSSLDEFLFDGPSAPLLIDDDDDN